MTTMRHLPVCAQDQDQLLMNGDTNERNGRLRGRRQARECAQPEPMLSSAGIDSQIHTPPSTGGEGVGGQAETNGREEEDCVEREEFTLMLEKTEGGVCLRVSGGCRGNAKARAARVQFVFVSVIACCSGYRRRNVHYADLLYFYTTWSTTLYLRPKDDLPISALSSYVPVGIRMYTAVLLGGVGRV